MCKGTVRGHLRAGCAGKCLRTACGATDGDRPVGHDPPLDHARRWWRKRVCVSAKPEQNNKEQPQQPMGIDKSETILHVITRLQVLY